MKKTLVAFLTVLTASVFPACGGGASEPVRAIDGGCDTLYSEDLNPGQRFGSLTIVNPFK